MRTAFSVYVHVPYCARKCPYCDFNVHVVRSIPEARYVEALLREVDGASRDDTWRGRRVATVFFGGGTPSMFSADSFGAVLDRLDERFGLEPGAEVSLEANPEDFRRRNAAAAAGGDAGGGADDGGRKLAALRAAGVNRLSLGAQSFAPHVLRTLGRMHDAADVEHAVRAARAGGFHNVALDLIFGVPGQTIDGWRHDLERALALGPDHVSTYGLTYEEGTPLRRRRDAGKIAALSEDDERAMYELAIDTLTAAGLRHYEISSFACDGREARHNLAYWSGGDYLGIGAGAHGFAGTCAEGRAGGGRGLRYENLRAPELYMERSPAARAWSERLDERMARMELVLVGLRRIEGLEERDLVDSASGGVEATSAALEELIGRGLLRREHGRVALTREGLLLADAVTARLAAR
jgi:oxygen-independent coproporphyrinogen-3 oxidase